MVQCSQVNSVVSSGPLRCFDCKWLDSKSCETMSPGTANPIVVAKTARCKGEDNRLRGLTDDEAGARRAKCGPNEMPDTELRAWRIALVKLLAPCHLAAR